MRVNVNDHSQIKVPHGKIGEVARAAGFNYDTTNKVLRGIKGVVSNENYEKIRRIALAFNPKVVRPIY